MSTDLLFSSIASAVAWLFTLLTFTQYRTRGRQHQLLWTLGIGSFALAVTADTVARAQGGWSDGGYRVWYFFGAMHGVTLLGQGTLHLLDRRAWTQRLLEVIGVLMIVSFLIVLNAPLDLTRLETPFEAKGTAFPDIGAMGFATPRFWTIPFNLYGTLWLIGGALYSTAQLWRVNRTRATGTLLIALSGVLLASVSSLNRFGITYLESVGRMVGVTVLFLGFLFTTLEPINLPRVNLPRIPPLVLFAALGWGFALFAFFQLEPAAWRALLEYPGLFLIAAIMLGLFWLVLQKARGRAQQFERENET
ncbi:MAG: hypothetical protein HC933_02860 [Pleurocapsa sp. SU_196_0]|nr:hypothetical protein [Pleurocapsa sp. SU_196_0]